MKHAGLFTYAWDFADEGVDDLAARIADLGITRVLVTSLYHAGFFMHPHNPRRRTHLLEDGVAYFHPSPECLDASPIRPEVAAMCADRDWFREICEKATRRGLAVSAWHVCLHNTRIGLAHPEATIHNVYGDSYPHALCAAHPHARAFVRETVGDLARRYPLASVLLEAVDYRRRAHGADWVSGHHHERDGVYLRPLEQALMDISFNPEDVRQAAEAGVDVESVRNAVRVHLDRYFDEAPDLPTGLPDTLDGFRAAVPPLADYEAHFRRAEQSLVQELHDVAAEQGVKLEGKAGPAVDWVCCGVYGKPPDAVEHIAREAKSCLLPHQELNVGVRLGFNHPGMGSPLLSEDDTRAVTAAVAAAGADEILFYNYGEAPRKSVEWIRPALAAVRGTRS